MLKKFSIVLISLFCLFLIILTTFCSKLEKRTVLKFSSWGSESEIAILKPLLKEFEEKNTDIKVEFIHIPKNYFQKIHLLIASNLTPDVIFLNNLNGVVYAKNNILENLDEYLKKDNEISRKDFFDESLNALSYQKRLYAIPRDVSNLVIYYNKNIFDKYHVPYPKEDWSFADFKNTAQLLTKDFNNDKKIDLFGSSFDENSLFWLPFLWSNGGGIISSDMKIVNISKPESIEALQFYADLRNRWHIAPRASEQGSSTMAQMFMQSKVAMFISGRWSVPKFRRDLEFNWDIARFPHGRAGSIVDADASGWGISSTSHHKSEAWRLIKFLASRTSCENFTTSGLIVPARHDVAKSKVFLEKNKKPANSELFVKIIPESIPTPANENYQEITDVVDSAFEPLWLGQKPAREVVNCDLVLKIKQLLN